MFWMIQSVGLCPTEYRYVWHCILLDQFVVLKDWNANSKFGYYFLLSPPFQKHLKSITGGTATPTVSQKNIGLTMFPCPSILAQNRIVSELDALMAMTETLEADYQTELDNLEELRQSILEQAFEGKLTESVAA